MTRIALIDDSRIDECYVSACLRKAGWAVEPIASDDSLGIIGQLLERPPDLLVLDYMLPKLKGDAIAEVCHQHPALKEMPIIVLTAHRDPELNRRLRLLGVKEVLYKAIKHNHLIHAVRRHLPATCDPGRR